MRRGDVERAAALLAAEAEAARAGRPRGPIAIDGVAAALLGPQFDVGPSEDGAGLRLLGAHGGPPGARTLLGLAPRA